MNDVNYIYANEKHKILFQREYLQNKETPFIISTNLCEQVFNYFIT